MMVKNISVGIWRIILALGMFVFVSTANATTVGSISATPEIWLGDPVNITAVCTGNSDHANVDISSPDMVLSSLDMPSLGGGAYALSVPGNYFSRRGTYTALVTCAEGNQTANSSTTFVISDMTLDISAPSTVYERDTIEIVAQPKKNDVTLTSGVSFDVFLDDAAIAPAIPPIYEPARGWVLRIQAPDAKVYTLSITTNYQIESISDSAPITVKPLIDFSIITADKNTVQNGDNVTLTLRALKRGVVVNLDNFAVRVNGATANIFSTLQSGTTYLAGVNMPSMGPGKYPLTAEITNNGTLYTTSINVSYVSTISGDLGVKDAAIIFSRNGGELMRLTPLTDGTYSGRLIPDTYDVSLENSAADIDIFGANVNSLNDAISYTYTPDSVDGLNTAGVFYVKVPWTFSTATLKIKYDPAALDGDIYIFRCDSWNGMRCAGSWYKTIPDIDGVQHVAKITTTNLGAFAVATEQKIKVTVNFDKKKYARRDVVSVKGLTSAGNLPLGNVSVRLVIDGTLDQTIYSNANGAFSLDFIGPGDEGNFTMAVTGKKNPYVQYNGNYNVETISMPAISVVFPSTVQVGYNNKSVQDIFIVNTGQSDLTGLKISADLDGKYYSVGNYPDKLAMKQDIHVPITFYSGEPGTTSAKLTVSSSEVSQDKTFGFTTLEQSKAAAITGMAIALPGMNDTMIIVIFAAVAFSGAFILKRHRSGRLPAHRPMPKIEANRLKESRRPARIENTNAEYLSNIKNHLDKKSGRQA